MNDILETVQMVAVTLAIAPVVALAIGVGLWIRTRKNTHS